MGLYGRGGGGWGGGGGGRGSSSIPFSVFLLSSASPSCLVCRRIFCFFFPFFSYSFVFRSFSFARSFSSIFSSSLFYFFFFLLLLFGSSIGLVSNRGKGGIDGPEGKRREGKRMKGKEREEKEGKGRN